MVEYRIDDCSDSCMCCHTETEVADQTFYLIQSMYTDTWPTSPYNAWHLAGQPLTEKSIFKLLVWLNLEKNLQGSNPGLPFLRRTPYPLRQQGGLTSTWHVASDKCSMCCMQFVQNPLQRTFWWQFMVQWGDCEKSWIAPFNVTFSTTCQW